jgi:xylitol oxidase
VSDARLEPSPRALETADQWNWARTHRFQATQIYRPKTVEEVQSAIGAAMASGSTIGCVGSRHSFTGIADGVVLLDLASMPERFEISVERASVTVNSAMIYSRLAELLRPTGLALANLASLHHSTVAGPISTATHGSGDANTNLAAAVRSLDVVTYTGLLG